MEKVNYRPDEVAKILDCSRKTVFRLIANDQLRAFRLGGHKKGGLRIPRDVLDAYIKRHIRGCSSQDVMSRLFLILIPSKRLDGLVDGFELLDDHNILYVKTSGNTKLHCSGSCDSLF